MSPLRESVCVGVDLDPRKVCALSCVVGQCVVVAWVARIFILLSHAPTLVMLGLKVMLLAVPVAVLLLAVVPHLLAILSGSRILFMVLLLLSPSA